MPIVANVHILIPWSEAELHQEEPHVRNLLPLNMRTPVNVDGASTANVSSLSGYQTIDGVTYTTGSPLILLKDQTDRRQNGVWTMAAGSWTRGPVALQVMPTMGTVAQNVSMVPQIGYLSTFLVRSGTANKGTYFFCTSPDPNIPGTSDIMIEKLGASLFEWHAQQAEREIVRDLDKPMKPIKLSYLADLSQLTFIKHCKMIERLYHGAPANDMSGGPDRSERMRNYWQKRYENELNNTTLRTVGQARIKGGSVRVIRGA